MSANQPNEETILEKAVSFANAEQREAYLEGACQGNPELRSRIESLIQAHQAAGGFLGEKAAEATPTVDLSTPDTGPGTIIGHYKLLQKIGEGGCGLVYMAEQHEPVRRRVALKIIKQGMDIYHQNAYTRLSLVTFSRELLEMPAQARAKALIKVRQLEQSFLTPLENLRAPP